jgi:tetratricopeptide (TPR) repeat protein
LVVSDKTEKKPTQCKACGSKYVLLDRYDKVCASLPDVAATATVEADYWTSATDIEIEEINLSLVLREHGQPEQAEQLQQRILLAWEERLGDDTIELATALNLLARVLQERQHHEAALTLLQRVVRICEQYTVDANDLLSPALNNLGVSLLCLGREQEAEDILIRLSRLVPSFANPHFWLAKLYSTRGAEAVALEEAHLNAYLDLNGENSARRQDALLRLTEIVFRRGEIAKARKLWNENSIQN